MSMSCGITGMSIQHRTLVLLVLFCTIPVFMAGDADLDGLFWEEVETPSGNVVWRRVEYEQAVSKGPAIKVLEPSEGTVWVQGRQVEVRWKCWEVTWVRIELYERKVHPSQYIMTITHVAPALNPALGPNLGNYKFNISLEKHSYLPIDQEYRIGVVSHEDSHVIGQSALFRIIRLPEVD